MKKKALLLSITQCENFMLHARKKKLCQISVPTMAHVKQWFLRGFNTNRWFVLSSIETS